MKQPRLAASDTGGIVKKLLVLCLLAALLVSACGSGSDGEESDPEGGAGDATAEQSSGDSCQNSLQVVNSEVADGAFDVVTGWSEGAPHPASTVSSDDQNAAFLITDYEVEPDEQFGYAIPQPGTEVADGGLELNLSIFAPHEPIASGMEFVSQTADGVDSADGEINFQSLFFGSERLGPLGDHTLTVTEVTDEKICGELTGMSETDLQELTAINGTFVADRTEFIEQAE